jgi:hypothetical protein
MTSTSSEDYHRYKGASFDASMMTISHFNVDRDNLNAGNIYRNFHGLRVEHLAFFNNLCPSEPAQTFTKLTEFETQTFAVCAF